MTSLYLFCLAVGGPVLAWILFAGLGADSLDGIGGDGIGDGGLDGIGDGGLDGIGGDGHGGSDGIMSVIPLSSVAFVMTFFGATGLAFGSVGASVVFAFVMAVTIGVGAGVVNSAAFSWLRRNSASSDVSSRELEGSIATVILPVDTHHRGRIVVNVAGAREQMTASPADGTSMGVGDKVVIVRMSGGVALVASLDAALGTGHEID